LEFRRVLFRSPVQAMAVPTIAVSGHCFDDQNNPVACCEDPNTGDEIACGGAHMAGDSFGGGGEFAPSLTMMGDLATMSNDRFGAGTGNPETLFGDDELPPYYS